MRLGDDIDDHCSRCKRSTDHSVVAMSGDEVLKTRCRTCGGEHKFRQNKSRTKEMTAKEAFHRRVLDAYLAIAKREPERVVKVDARDPIPEVHRKIVGSVEERLMKKSSS